MENNMFGYGSLNSYGQFAATGLAFGDREPNKMTEANKEEIIMRCRDANTNEELKEILDRVGDDDSWGEISEIVNRIR